MQINRNKSPKLLLLTGIFLISVLFFSLTITNVLFLCSIPISSANLLLSFLVSVGVCILFSRDDKKKALIASVVGIVTIVLCTLLVLQIDDWTWDGNTYHKALTGFLKYGWNPLEESFFSFRDQHFPIFDYISVSWYDSYPKATETFGACIYVIVENIEAGKSYNLIAVFAVIFILSGYLATVKSFTFVKAMICAVFFALNPVVIAQLFTYYNDGFMWQLWLICCAALIYLTLSDTHTYTKESFYLIFATIGIGLNTKFSALIFFSLLCIAFFVYWCLDYTRQETNKRAQVSYISKRFIFFALSVFSACFLLGATSYVTNLIRYGNPLHGTFGVGTVDIITPNLPAIYNKLPGFVGFIASVFSKSSNSLYLTEIEWKLPFIVDPSELTAMHFSDTRIGGWGVFFSGLLLLGVYIIYRNCKRFKAQKKLWDICIMLGFVNLVWILFVPAMCWARYYVAPLYVPVLAMMILFSAPNCSAKHLLGAICIAILLILNFLPNCQKNSQLVKTTQNNHAQLATLQNTAKYGDIVVDTSIPGGGEGLYFTLLDMDIPNVTYQSIPDTECSYIMDLVFPIGYQVTCGPFSCTNTEDYLNMLNDLDKTDYLILISAKDEASNALTEEIISQMQQLGLDFPLEGQYQNSYLAVIDGGRRVAESCNQEALSFEAQINNSSIYVSSAGANAGNHSSIQINQTEYSHNLRGLNIVLVDRNTGEVVDSVSIDTWENNVFSR